MTTHRGEGLACSHRLVQPGRRGPAPAELTAGRNERGSILRALRGMKLGALVAGTRAGAGGMWQQRRRRRLEQRGRWRRLQFGRQQQLRPGQEDREGRPGLRRRRPRRQVVQRPGRRRPGDGEAEPQRPDQGTRPRSRARATRRRPSASRCWPSPATTRSSRSASRTPPRWARSRRSSRRRTSPSSTTANCSSKAQPNRPPNVPAAVHRERRAPTWSASRPRWPTRPSRSASSVASTRR